MKLKKTLNFMVLVLMFALLIVPVFVEKIGIWGWFWTAVMLLVVVFEGLSIWTQKDAAGKGQTLTQTFRAYARENYWRAVGILICWCLGMVLLVIHLIGGIGP